MNRFDRARSILNDGVRMKAFPAAVIEVGTADTVLWHEAFGHCTYDTDTPATDSETIFDLASLTKVIATTTLLMGLQEASKIHTNEQVSLRLSRWTNNDRSAVTISDLMDHSSGLSAHQPLYHTCTGRQEFEEAICDLPLEYAPRSQSIYSDLGFILLGFLIEDVGGQSLADQFMAFTKRADLNDLRYDPPDTWRSRIAPSGFSQWRNRLLHAEVHDDNAWALGSAAGHSGLFGSATAVGKFARLILQGYESETVFGRTETVRAFTTRSGVPNSSRALGWDRMLPTSSCGTRMSPSSIGHTGFTGTSLWIDPAIDLYIVLLANRLYPTTNNAHTAIQTIRPLLHDAVIKDWLTE